MKTTAILEFFAAVCATHPGEAQRLVDGARDGRWDRPAPPDEPSSPLPRLGHPFKGWPLGDAAIEMARIREKLAKR